MSDGENISGEQLNTEMTLRSHSDHSSVNLIMPETHIVTVRNPRSSVDVVDRGQETGTSACGTGTS